MIIEESKREEGADIDPKKVTINFVGLSYGNKYSFAVSQYQKPKYLYLRIKCPVNKFDMNNYTLQYSLVDSTNSSEEIKWVPILDQQLNTTAQHQHIVLRDYTPPDGEYKNVVIAEEGKIYIIRFRLVNKKTNKIGNSTKGRVIHTTNTDPSRYKTPDRTTYNLEVIEP